MFSKKQRLQKQKNVKLIFQSKKSAYNKLLGLKLIKNKFTYNRYTVVVGKKVSKRAVDRNKIKRRLRASLKEYNLFIKQGWDIVVIVLPEAKQANFANLNKALKNLLKRTYLIKKNEKNT